MIKLNKYLKELGVDENNYYIKTEKKNPKYMPDDDTEIPESYTYSMDGALAMVIYTYLRKYKDTKRCAYPGNLTSEKWESILDEMINGFASMIKEEESKRAFKKQKRALALFKTYFFNLGW